MTYNPIQNTRHARNAKSILAGAVATGMLALSATPSLAVEGGTGAYLLGSRDSFAGIVPPPGTYFSSDLVHLDGEVGFLALGGKPFVDVSTGAYVLKLNLTHSFDARLWGGQPAITVTLPMATGDLDLGGELGSGLSGDLTDSNSGFSDIIITPLVGWSNGNQHWSVGASIFLPTGKYDTATVDVATRSVNALSFGKNRAAIDPVVAYTYLNPKTGIEFSAAGGVTFSAKNDATDYQTAPEAHLELTAMQHLPSKVAVGLTGYAYHQIGDDSGSGADSIKLATGQDSLQAQTYGLGPIITYSTKIGDTAVSFKAKYIHEFDAKKRFESDVVWLNMSISF